METYCGHYITCGWDADQTACMDTTQPYIDDCVGTVADWINCSCACLDGLECADATALNDCLIGCYAAN